VAAALHCSYLAGLGAREALHGGLVDLAADCARLVVSGCVSPRLAEPAAVLASLGGSLALSGVLDVFI